MQVTIKTEFIKLNQLLKFAGVCGSGGEADIIIKDGMVSVNGEKCEMRGKKIRTGDKVSIKKGDTIEVL